ncbi:MAG: D-alanyl-D-alanine endopeptidase [Rhodocyclaceae bacterium]|nr:D-alanyl-D-alanine endopeptidase [Rhodocyclaceae bacterium]
MKTSRWVVTLATVLGITLAFPQVAQAEYRKSGKRHAVARHAAKAPAKKTAAVYRKANRGASEPDFMADGSPNIKSAAVLVQDSSSGEILYSRNADSVVPIASITKLMTAMVVLDAKPSLDEQIAVNDEDIDTIKGTHSRLYVGAELSREEMLRLALMSSENRAASALGRNYPGGRAAFIAAMNRKSAELGLHNTRFYDTTGLNPSNVSSPQDLARMVEAASHYPLIREFTTEREYRVAVGERNMRFVNTNALVSNPDWQIGVSKTGYTNEAGKCLVMKAWLREKPVIIVLLDSVGRLTRIGDANRIKKWVEKVSLGAQAAME